MLAFCGLLWWKKLEFPENTTNTWWAITTLPHAEAGNRTYATAVPNEGLAPALSRLYIITFTLFKGYFIDTVKNNPITLGKKNPYDYH